MHYYSNFFIYSENLIHAVMYLDQMNIVHFDISLKNIRVNEDTNKAIIIDFGMSIIIDNLITNSDMKGNVTGFNPSLLKMYFSINPITSPKYCFETQLLCFINFNYDDFNKTFSDSDFKSIIQKYYTKNQLFYLFTTEFKDAYITDIYKIYSPYVGKPVKNLICACLTTWRTWDSFNLHFHFITLLYNMDSFNLLTLQMIELSMRQIHSNPNKRLSTPKVIESYYKILDNQSIGDALQYKTLIQEMNYKKVKYSFDSSYNALHSYQPQKK
ncbi:hypothetical protein CL656_04720 [bacterium]|nr:hypothetical protein [bacterium]